MSVVIGIDPGKNGGVAMSVAGDVTVHRLPSAPGALTTMLRCWKLAYPDIVCYVERISSSPQMGVVSAFTFGQGYGQILEATHGLDIRTWRVEPKAWQKRFDIKYDKGMTSTQKKNVTKAKAIEYFPKIHERVGITHWMADALLMMRYGVEDEG